MAKILSIGVVILVLIALAYYFSSSRVPDASMGGNATSTGQASGTSEEAGVFTEVDPLMVGTWKSEEDGKFSREFRADGTVVDRYEGDASATATGTFATIDPAWVEVPGVPANNLAGMTVLRVMWENDPAPMFFSINTMTNTELSMTSLSGRGNILMFTKAD